MKKSKAPAPPVSGLKSVKDSEQKKKVSSDLLCSYFGILFRFAADSKWYPVLEEYCKIDLLDNGCEMKQRYKIVAKKPSEEDIFLLEYNINSSTMIGMKEKFVRWNDQNYMHGIQFSKVSSAEEFYEKVTTAIADLCPDPKVDKILDQYGRNMKDIPVEEFFNSSVRVDKDKEIASGMEDNENSDVEQDGNKRRLLQTEMKELLMQEGGKRYLDLIEDSMVSHEELVNSMEFSQNKTSDAEPSNTAFPVYHKASTVSTSMNFNKDSDHVDLRRCHSVDALSPIEQHKFTIKTKRQAPLPPTMVEDVSSLAQGKPTRLKKSIENISSVSNLELKEDSVLVGKKRRAPRPPGAVVPTRMSENAAVKSDIAEAVGHHLIVCEQNENGIVAFSDEQSILIRSEVGNQESAAVSPFRSPSYGHKEEKHRSLSEEILTDNNDGKISTSHASDRQRGGQPLIGTFPAEEVIQKTEALLVKLPEGRSPDECFDKVESTTLSTRFFYDPVEDEVSFAGETSEYFKNPHTCEDNQQIVSNASSGDFLNYAENKKPLEEKINSTRLSLPSSELIVNVDKGRHVKFEEVFIEEMDKAIQFNLQPDPTSVDSVKTSAEVCADEKLIMLDGPQSQQKSVKQFEKAVESLSSTLQPVHSGEAVHSKDHTNYLYAASQSNDKNMSKNRFQKEGLATISFLTNEELTETTKEDQALQSNGVNNVSQSGIDQFDINCLRRKSTSFEGDHTISGSMSSQDSVGLTLRVLQHQASSVNQNVARIQSIQSEQEKVQLLNPLLLQRKILEKMINAYVESDLIPVLHMEALKTHACSPGKDTNLESCKSDKINDEKEISHRPKMEVIEETVYAENVDAKKKQMSQYEHNNEIANKLSIEEIMYTDDRSTVFQNKTTSKVVEAGADDLFQFKTGKLLQVTPGDYSADKASMAKEAHADLVCHSEVVESRNEYKISPLLIKERNSLIEDGIDLSKSEKFIGEKENLNQIPVDKKICSGRQELMRTACLPLATRSEQNTSQESNFTQFYQPRIMMPVLISDTQISCTTGESPFSPAQQEEKYEGFDHSNSSQPISEIDGVMKKYFTDSPADEITANETCSLGDESPDNDKVKYSITESAIHKKELLIKQLTNQENRKPRQSAAIAEPKIGLKIGEEVVGGESKHKESKTDHAKVKNEFCDAQPCILPFANDCNETLFSSNRNQQPNYLKLNESSALKKLQRAPIIDVRKIANRNDSIECWDISKKILNQQFIKRIKSKRDITLSPQEDELNAGSEETKSNHPGHERLEAQVSKLGGYSSFQEITETDDHTKRTVAMRKVRGLQIRSSRDLAPMAINK